MQISVVIITFNEENNIDQCLKAASQVADEIVVLDSFSTDKTEEICKKYNVNFVTRKWEGYTLSKNHANKIAKFDWILSLDADEVLSDVLINSLNELKSNLKENVVYSIKRLPNYCGQWIYHSGWNPDIKIRLFNKTSSYWQGEFIHETIFVPQNHLTTLLKGDCYHYTVHSIQEHINQINKFSELQAIEMFKKGKKANLFHFIVKPFFEFFKSYVIKRGFLDGKYGFIISSLNAFSRFAKYSKLYQLNQNKGK